MSRDFEQAYIELAQAEIPDLWDRIEAGLSERSTPVDLAKTEEVKESVTEKSKKRKVVIFTRKYSAVAAALLCAVILMPAFFLIKQFGTDGSKPEISEMIQYAETPTEGIAEKTIQATSEAAMEESSEGTSQNMMEESDEAASEEMLSEDTLAYAAEDKAAQKESSEAAVICNVQIKVIEVTQAQDCFAGTEREESGQMCVAEVHNSPRELLTQGEQIVIFIPITSSMALTKDGVYEVDLVSFTVGEECFYEIEQFHKQLEP